MLLDKMPPEELQIEVSAFHFSSAFHQVNPSVSAAELAHYEKLRVQFSSIQA